MTTTTTKKTPRLKAYYQKEIVSKLKKDLGLKNAMQVPAMKKIVVNMGLGEAVQNPKAIESAVAHMTEICGQKPVVTLARKSIATYKLRAGMPIGAMVTLRGDRMWTFFDRLVNIAIPRVRDFRGIGSKFDGRGSCSIGLKEQIIFPEINYDTVDKIRGMNITIVTSARTDEHGRALLKELGMPFRR